MTLDLKRAFLLLAMLGAGLARAAGVDSFFAATLETPAGQSVELESFRGKPLVVNFIAKNCDSCRADTAELARLRQAGGEFVLLSVVIEENPEAQADYVKSLGVAHPVLVANNRKGVWLMQNLGNPRGRAPFTVAIDRQGRIAARLADALTPQQAAEAAAAARQ